MYKNQKGEIATFISIAALIGMAVFTFITSTINTNISQKQITSTNAQECACGTEEDTSVCAEREQIRYISGYNQSCFDSEDTMGDCEWRDDPNKPIYDTYEGECIAYGIRCSVCSQGDQRNPDEYQGFGTSGTCACENGYWNYHCDNAYQSCNQYSEEESQYKADDFQGFGSEGTCQCENGYWNYNCDNAYQSCNQYSEEESQYKADDFQGFGTSNDEESACSVGHCASYGQSSCDSAYDPTGESCQDAYGPSVCCANKEYTPVSCDDTSYTCRIGLEDCNAFSTAGTYLQSGSCTNTNGGTGVCCKENTDSKTQQSGSSCSDATYTCMPYSDCSEASSEKTYVSGGSCQTDDGISGTCCKESGASETAVECTGSCFTETCTTVNRTGATGRCDEDKNCCAREEDLISASGVCENNGGQCIGEGSYDETKHTRISGKCPTGYGDVSICVKDKSETDVSKECETAGGQCISGDAFDETKQIKISGRCPAALGEPNVCVKDKDATDTKTCEAAQGECKSDSEVDTKVYQKVDGATCEESTQSCYKKTNEGGQGYVLINDTPQKSYSEGEIATITVGNVPSEYTEENPANIYFSVKDNGDGTWTYNVDRPADVPASVTPGSGYEVKNGNN